MKILVLKIDTSHEVEDALTVFAQDNLKALGTEVRKRSDFQQAGWLHDSTVVDLSAIHDLPADMQFLAYFPEETDKNKLIQRFAAKLAQLKTYGLKIGKGKISIDEIADQDWNTAWQKYYHVIHFSRHLAIVPAWEHYQPAFKDQQILKMNPGLAFGTGKHQTTQLALMGLERGMFKPCSVADVGTGSGILAIAAAKLGASKVLATDVDAEAITAAQQNAKLNGLKQITLQRTSLLTNVSGRFDIIVANILAEILLKLIPQLGPHLKTDGQVIFSGIDYLQLPDIKKSLTKHGFKIDLQLQQDRWVSLVITRKEEGLC